MASNLPGGDYCPIGPLNLHTMNFERTECIWCGPGGLAWKPGHWVQVHPHGEGDPLGAYSVWSATEPFEYDMNGRIEAADQAS